jgi:hypothetical protein
MNIDLGELREPIAPLCNSKNDIWNGIMRVYLRKPKVDGNALLEGTQIFALELDEETTMAKVCCGFDSIASNNELRITSKVLFNCLLTSSLKQLSVTTSGIAKNSRLPKY